MHVTDVNSLSMFVIYFYLFWCSYTSMTYAKRTSKIISTYLLDVMLWHYFCLLDNVISFIDVHITLHLASINIPVIINVS